MYTTAKNAPPTLRSNAHSYLLHTGRAGCARWRVEWRCRATGMTAVLRMRLQRDKRVELTSIRIVQAVRGMGVVGFWGSIHTCPLGLPQKLRMVTTGVEAALQLFEVLKA